jgi:cytochrome c-type biogenesis protein CcmH/NrfG
MNRKERRAQSKKLSESESRAPSHLGQARDLAAAGFMYHQAGRLPEAEKSYLDALQIDPDNIDALYLLGIVCFGTRRRDAGIKQMRAVLKRQPQNPNALYSLAVACHEEGKLDDAIVHYTELLRIKPD